MIERLERLTPVVAASPTLFRVPEHRELLESGLRLAAGGEDCGRALAGHADHLAAGRACD